MYWQLFLEHLGGFYLFFFWGGEGEGDGLEVVDWHFSDIFVSKTISNPLYFFSFTFLNAAYDVSSGE